MADVFSPLAALFCKVWVGWICLLLSEWYKNDPRMGKAYSLRQGMILRMVQIGIFLLPPSHPQFYSTYLRALGPPFLAMFEPPEPEPALIRFLHMKRSEG